MVRIGIIKKSSSGRALQFITDDGDVYQLSVGLFDSVMRETIKGDFVVLSRMAIPVPHDRFPKSPVWGDKGLESAVDTAGIDAFSKEFTTVRKQQKDGKKVSEFKIEW